MMIDLPKTYNPKVVEEKWYKYWEDNDIFKVDSKSGRPPYCIIMPPPNITGQLHMGHALQDAIQDMLVRFKRMSGYTSHWQPGKDHAGIATQNVVEKQLASEGSDRHKIGRKKFLERAWEWKEKFGNRIFEQKRLLGDSADWSRERFTLSPELTRTVHSVFKKLHDKGLIYRGHYIVNWCPRCHTAISDEEVTHKDHDHHLWYFKYPFKDESGFVTVATTRPETMLGDTAVAVNPGDERFKSIIGRKVVLPLANREIHVVADDFVDPTFGTGQVKVTPAHDVNDFDMGVRNNLPSILVIDEDGRMNENVPEQFQGLDRFEARKAVVKALDDLGYLEKIEDYKTSIGHCQRCTTIIEPYLSLQWFVKMKPLAQPAIDAVKNGEIKFYPPRWEKVYYAWMENIRDWCISRQLWWGHRFPVWYCDDCNDIMVEIDPPEECSKCKSTNIRQDEDVLDTWFSSWLWAFSSLGWPEDKEDYDFWYPSDVMVTGYDIIFFWVARMIMAGLEFTDSIPFKDVYITGMIRDELGRWMSKSLGNGIDPQDMVNQYGSDAVRFTLISLASEGQDIKLTPSRFESGRNFSNKLWNSYRFLQSHVAKLETLPVINQNLQIDKNSHISDKWIASRLKKLLLKISESGEKYRVNDIANSIYDFIWKDYCDWYLEAVKIRLNDCIDPGEKRGVIEIAIAIFERSIRILHPTMPFITEEIWSGLSQYFDYDSPDSILNSVYPQKADYLDDPKAEKEFDFIQRIIGSIRNIRSEMRVPPDRRAELIFNSKGEFHISSIKANKSLIINLGKISKIDFSGARPENSASSVIEEVEIYIPLAGLIDLDVEKRRMNKEIGRLENVVKSAQRKLSNPRFTEKAPKEIQDHEREKLSDCQSQLELVRRNLLAIR